jgi:inosine-uridine nucleoside N-ribohydrolase
VSYGDCEKLRALGTPAGSAAAEFVGHRIQVHDEIQRMAVAGTTPVHDAVCVGYLVDPKIITTRRYHVAVETSGTLTVGRTVIDTHFRGGEKPQCDVAFDADAGRFIALLLETFGKKSTTFGGVSL